MCAPSVIALVRQDLSRRGFLAALGGTVAASVTAPGPAFAQQTRKPLRLPRGFRNIYDLTHTFTPRLPVFPAFKPVQIRERFTIATDGFFANEITFDEHTGTHMDGPAHMVANAATADRIVVDRLFAPLAVVSIASKAAKDADATLTVDDLRAWEKRHGRLPRGAFVAMHAGWDLRIADPARFLNKDAAGTMHAPGFSEEAAMFLAHERDIVGAGVDTLSLDIGAAPKHEGASGGPVRVFAVA